MSAKSFIAELDRRKLLSDRLMAKLRTSVAEIHKPLSADALAKFLVQKKLLTSDQANDVLSGLTLSGINLAEVDTDSPIASEANDASSVLSSHIGTGTVVHQPTAVDDSDDEIRLAPIQDEEEGIVRLVPLSDDVQSIQQKPLEELDSEDDLLSGDEDQELELEPQAEEVPTASRQRRRERIIEEPLEPSSLDAEISFGRESASAGGATAAPPTAHQKAAIRRIADRKKKGKPTKGKKRWDAPIILFGGGTLAFLILAGGMIWFLIFRESGDQMLMQAREAANSGAYPQAIQHFQDFLTASPSHPEHSAGRVELAMVRIRQATDSHEFAPALATAQTELKAIEDEPAFDNAHKEAAALLPQIAEGLAKQAEQSPPTSDGAKKLVELSNQALELCNNVAYVPKTLRDETRLANVRDALERIELRQKSQFALDECIKTMEEAVAAAKPMDAYAAYAKLLSEHPELATEASLAEAVKKVTSAEQAAINFVSEKKPAETAERPTPWLAALAVANRRLAGTAPGVSGPACIRVDGAIYGLEAATGQLLWRRYVGYQPAGWPIPLGHDILISDTARHELLRLEAATGKLIWRQSFDEPFDEPLVVDDRAFVPSNSGRLYVVDLKSGERTGFLKCPQSLHVAPAIDRTKTRLYLAANRATVYSLSLPDLKCNGVYFLGHAPGAIQAPPLLVMDKLAIVENNGVETSHLHLLAPDNKGTLTKEQAKRRLAGLVTSPLLTTGRGLIVTTDRGQIEVYDIAAGNEGEVLTPVATRDATGSEPVTRHVALVGKNVWVADTQLTKYNIVPTGSRLPVEEIENNFAGATFDHPLIPMGATLIEVHRPKGQAGAVIGAIDTKNGHTLWEVQVAMPPAGAAVVDAQAKAITVANAAGFAFRFDENAIRARVQDQPLPAQLAPPQLPVLSTSTDLGQGRAAFSAAGSDSLLLYNPAAGAGAKWVHLDSPLACKPTSFGAGILLPLKIGQVFNLNSADGARLAAPFQPRVDLQTPPAFAPATAVNNDNRQFVITDGVKKVYLVALTESPQPHLEAVKEGEAGPRPITTPFVVLGDTALAVAGDSRLVKFKLPSLETAGESNLPAPLEWGPYAANDVALVATSDQKLLALTANGEPRWQASLENGPLAGPPLVLPDGVLLAYRKGILERRSLADGKPLATRNVEQPLATGPVAFLQKLVVTGNDGAILVVDQPEQKPGG